MAHSVSVLRLLTGFDCEGKLGHVVQVTFAVNMTLHLLNAYAKFLGANNVYYGRCANSEVHCNLLKRTNNLIYATAP